MCYICAQRCPHEYKRFLNLCLVRVTLVLVCFQRFILDFCVFLCSFRSLWFCVVSFVGLWFLFSAAPRNWLGRTSPKWPILDVKPCSTHPPVSASLHAVDLSADAERMPWRAASSLWITHLLKAPCSRALCGEAYAPSRLFADSSRKPRSQHTNWTELTRTSRPS